MWYLNPKNIIMMVLGVALIGLSTTYLFQRTTLAHIEAENKQLITDNLIQTATIGGLNRNIKAIEKHQQRVQIVEKNTQTVREIVKLVKPDTPLGETCKETIPITPEEKQRAQDEQDKIQDAVAAAITLFNTGVYSSKGDNPAAKEVLSPSGGTEIKDADKGTPKDTE